MPTHATLTVLMLDPWYDVESIVADALAERSMHLVNRPSMAAVWKYLASHGADLVIIPGWHWPELKAAAIAEHADESSIITPPFLLLWESGDIPETFEVLGDDPVVDIFYWPGQAHDMAERAHILARLGFKFRSSRVRNLKQERTLDKLHSLRRALVLSEERYRIICDYGSNWESWVGPDGEMLYVSLACERITGYPPEMFMEDPTFIQYLIHPDDLPAWRQFMERSQSTPDEALDFRFRHKDGRIRWITQVNRLVTGRDGASRGIRCSMIDITDRKNMEMEFRHQALHDHLTGLANRTLCESRIKRSVERAKRRDDYHYAVVFVDLDRFKIINDSLGHTAGDRLLIEAGQRLKSCIRDLDTVSRFGGDEFVLLLEELTSPRDAIRTVVRIRKRLKEPMVILGHEVQLSASFGIVLSTARYTSPQSILQNADIALHLAKSKGRDRLKVFTPRLLDQAVQAMTMEHELRRAVAREEFILDYQPILSLADSRLIGFEALVRWNHPEKGVVPPGDFIPIAEESGLIIEIGYWILAEACRTMARWRSTMPEADHLILSVNVSGRQFAQQDIVDQIRNILEITGMEPSRLKLEITETTIMEHAASASDKLRRLKDMGLKLSIDDFGTGYSSMSYLQQFPIDHLKIDLSFVRQIASAPESLEIVKGIISLAHGLKLKVIAEGVELEEQQRILSDLNCEYGQGYLYSRPISRSDAEHFIRSYAMAKPVPMIPLSGAC